MWGGGKGCSCKLERKKNFRKRQKEKRVGKRERNKNRKQFRKTFNGSKLPLFQLKHRGNNNSDNMNIQDSFQRPPRAPGELENGGEKTCNFMWVQDSRAVLTTMSFFSVPGVVQHPPTPPTNKMIKQTVHLTFSRIFLEKENENFFYPMRWHLWDFFCLGKNVVDIFFVGSECKCVMFFHRLQT